jgi:centrosome and spindle pole-associated protein 1
MSIGHPNQMSSQRQPQQNGRHTQPYRNDNRSGPSDNGFQIGHDVDKDAEQASKKRYQQELQAQMREAQMRKAQAKQDKDEYERKLDAEVQRYNYFGRNGGGGGAPMRDKDGNVVANLADVRNPPPPPPPPQQQQHQQQQQYYPPDDKAYSLGYGTSAITNAPFYNGAPEQQYSSNTVN